MNKYDQDNLSFLLSLSPKDFDQWIKQISLDDVEYALMLLKHQRAHLSLMAVENNDDVSDLTQAAQVINFIRSK